MIAVWGGYGVFGSLVCRELSQRGARVTVIGRNLARARAFAAALGSGHSAAAADAADGTAVRAALAGHTVAVHCAGPYRDLPLTLAEACLDTGCHYVDIADDRAYVGRIRGMDARAVERGLTLAFGCSSLPGISGALALALTASHGRPPERLRVTLFIGNDNPKSAAAIRSVVSGLGAPIAAPQGVLHGFRERERVLLPPPFGIRTAYAFESPDYDLLPAATGAAAVTVLVGFENALAGPAFALLARLGPRRGAGTSRLLAALGALDRRGHSGGAVVVDCIETGAVVRRAGLYTPRDGQRLAAVPAALVAHALATGAVLPRGAHPAFDLLGVEGFLAELEAAGFERWSGT